MSTRAAIIAIFAIIGSFASASRAGDDAAPYKDYRWVEVRPRSTREFLALQQIGEPLNCIPSPDRLELLVAPDAMNTLDGIGAPYIVRSADAQTLVDRAYAQNEVARAARGTATFFTAYRTLDEINNYLTTLDTLPALPASQVVRVNAGSTIQGQTIYGLKISAPPVAGAPPKPQVLITATQHAREWAAGSSAMWICDRLARGYGTDPLVTNLLNNVEFHIIPICNPDGYVHSFPTSQGGGNSRLWRKNRRVNSNGSFGVDLNRNWSTGWGLDSGSSSSPSSDTYRGVAAFSEPETSTLQSYASSLTNLKGHIDIHTYSQLVLAPWGYTTAVAPRAAEMAPVTNSMVNAMSAVYSGFWRGGPTASTLYTASGVASDWMFQNRAALAWGFELRDEGFYGFTLPPDQIDEAANEAWEGFRVLAQHVQIRLRVGVPIPPTALSTSSSTAFGVTITAENAYTLQAGSSRLRWRVGSAGAFTDVPLTGSAPSFTATLPSQPCGTTIEYFVQGTASDGLVVTSPASGVYVALAPACAPCIGDADGNHLVNFADITSILVNFGASPGPFGPGDASGDGVVAFNDITNVLNSFNSACP